MSRFECDVSKGVITIKVCRVCNSHGSDVAGFANPQDKATMVDKYAQAEGKGLGKSESLSQCDRLRWPMSSLVSTLSVTKNELLVVH